ncbi:MAG: hypothetical protein ABIH86_05625 [Planctomycetota bacterium]
MTKSALAILAVISVITLVLTVVLLRQHSDSYDESKKYSPATEPPKTNVSREPLRFPLLTGGPKDDLFYQPRVAATSPDGQLYIMDKWGAVRAFSDTGERLANWSMPYVTSGEGVKGLPEAIAFDSDGTVIIADTHYGRVLFFQPDGRPLPEKTIGREGRDNGEFCYPSGLALDRVRRRLYVSEYGWNDRIQVFDLDSRTHIRTIGRRGIGLVEFDRVAALAFVPLPDGERLYVADAANHRIHVLSPDGQFIRSIGRFGSRLGELSYPYDIKIYDGLRRRDAACDSAVLDPDSAILCVCEYGNNRVQFFTLDGEPLAAIGEPGAALGQYFSPWAIGITSSGELIVTDTDNHRLQNAGRVMDIVSAARAARK